jgi:hypothetical protein
LLNHLCLFDDDDLCVLLLNSNRRTSPNLSLIKEHIGVTRELMYYLIIQVIKGVVYFLRFCLTTHQSSAVTYVAHNPLQESSFRLCHGDSVWSNFTLQ